LVDGTKKHNLKIFTTHRIVSSLKNVINVDRGHYGVCWSTTLFSVNPEIYYEIK